MSHALPSSMTVIETTEPGDPKVLVPGQRPLPEPGKGEVLIKVAATGVNGPDIMQRKGLYPAPKDASDLLGLEISGTIVKLGPDCDENLHGQKVCALTNGGGYAEYCTVSHDHCLPIPAGVDEIDAAGLPETYFTVWSNIFMTANLDAGETLLVHGGAGGIGSTAIQLGKAFGARVFATENPEARCQFCSDLGADSVINYEEENFVDIVREAGGANVILDIVGGPYIERNIRAATHDGRIVQLAFALGSKVEINFMPIMLKRLKYMGSTLRTRPNSFKTEIARQLIDRVWPKFSSDNLRSVTSSVLPLEEASQAHQMMEDATHAGKILLKI